LKLAVLENHGMAARNHQGKGRDVDLAASVARATFFLLTAGFGRNKLKIMPFPGQGPPASRWASPARSFPWNFPAAQWPRGRSLPRASGVRQ